MKQNGGFTYCDFTKVVVNMGSGKTATVQHINNNLVDSIAKENGKPLVIGGLTVTTDNGETKYRGVCYSEYTAGVNHQMIGGLSIHSTGPGTLVFTLA